ncbi:hypothetical protein GobsT_44180 [Gemmata obscuriglobus]|nr:hypothetical protein GobsT_44180 [Gemmata obscuriglobus]VTS08921.1 unnamed protein product [Gemmata obscuriglobus UQM 2246]
MMAVQVSLIVRQRRLRVSQKAALTILHVVMGALITLGGMQVAGSIASEQPLGALMVLAVSAVMPPLIATRVAWASGFAAGRVVRNTRGAEPGAAPDTAI